MAKHLFGLFQGAVYWAIYLCYLKNYMLRDPERKNGRQFT